MRARVCVHTLGERECRLGGVEGVHLVRRVSDEAFLATVLFI